MKRAIIIVIDSLGIGAMPDAAKYGDPPDCNTLVNIARTVGGLKLPNLEKMGLGNLQDIVGVTPVESPLASVGIMSEVSEGKDTTTGHWELAGLILDSPFRTYPNGFPDFIIQEFIKRASCGNVLGNCPASGTAIIDELGDKHVNTGYPIIYTSADSVFQIACHVDTVPLDKIHNWCEIARTLLDEYAQEHNVCRVIARPFEGVNGNYKRISAGRRDFSVVPPRPTVLDTIKELGGDVLGIGKIEDIFVKSGITRAIHTGTNRQGLELTLKAITGEIKGEKDLIVYNGVINPEFSLIFTNLVDTDMLYGHRNDIKGYANALEEIDVYIGELLSLLSADDILIITADHGCDPTVTGTDHTREKVPILLYSPALPPVKLGERETFADVAATVCNWANITYQGPGQSIINLNALDNHVY